jgi:glutaminyl-tRNA synthetase
VQDGHVEGWSDPRMPTISGLRRRGYTPEAIRNFCESVGIAKSSSVVDIRQLEFFIREDLNKKAQRAMAVLNPLKVVIVNYPEGKEEELDAVNNQEDPDQGKRQIPFAKEIYIEKEDFQEDPPKKFFRLAPGKEVRLAHAYYITCVDVIKDQKTGEIMELHCTYDPQTRGGWSQDGRKVKGTLHWVSLKHAKNAVVRLYDHLFRSPNPEEEKEGDDLDMLLNQDSLKVLEHCKVEPSLVSAKPAQRFQFLRQGYFCLDSQASEKGELVFNRTVSLKDSWAKMDKDS